MFMISRITKVLLMPGSVTCKIFWKRPAPSMAAASYRAGSMAVMAEI